MIRKTNLANRNNYGDKRSTSAIKYLVYHFTANDGDTDEANGNYFHNNVVWASAHLFVDDDSCTQSVPDNYVAYSVGGNKYPNTKGGKFYGLATNYNTLSIEMCDTQKNGKYDLSAKTRQNALEIGREKMKQYNIPIERVIRHYDVVGKICPKYFVENEAAWNAFKAELVNKPSNPSNKPSEPAKPNNPTPAKIDVKYQAYANGEWLSDIVNYNTSNTNGYAGYIGRPITAIRANTVGDAATAGKLQYRVHTKNGIWYNWQTDRIKDKNGENYAGDRKTQIDGVQFKITGVSGRHVKYRVHCIGKGWLSWITDCGEGSNGYAGWYGYTVDTIQIQIV